MKTKTTITNEATQNRPADKVKQAEAALVRADTFTKGRYFSFTYDELKACSRKDTYEGIISAFELGYMRGYNTGRRNARAK